MSTTDGTADALVDEYLASIATATHRRLGDVAGVAVTTGDEAHPRTRGASTELAVRVDQVQFEIGHGPCLNALSTGEGMYVPDLAHDERWGDYGRRAAALGAASCVSVPVRAADVTLGVFKVYASVRDGLDAAQRDLAAVVAAEIAGGFALARHLERQADQIQDLSDAMTTRRVIDLAVGVSMQRAGVGAQDAFALLRTQSQQSNVKLRDLAGDVVLSVPGASPSDLVVPFEPPA